MNPYIRANTNTILNVSVQRIIYLHSLQVLREIGLSQVETPFLTNQKILVKTITRQKIDGMGP